ncbi:MAG: PilT/PilU family type 4a pilus ATPase [Myxococcales bacterium]|nr:PilT/PilU family type 4a pilus ATPase [Myxococcales bacterium]
MLLSTDQLGNKIAGVLDQVSVPLLLAILEKCGATGHLEVVQGEKKCEMGLEEGCVVELLWGGEPFEAADDERSVMAALARQMKILFAWSHGEFTFVPERTASLKRIQPGKMPAIFLMRYGFAATTDKSLVHRLSEAAWGKGEVQVCLHPDSGPALKALGGKFEQDLQAYRSWASLASDELDETMTQLLVALWCVGMLEVAPPTSPTVRLHEIFKAVQKRLGEGEDPLELPDPLEPATEQGEVSEKKRRSLVRESLVAEEVESPPPSLPAMMTEEEVVSAAPSEASVLTPPQTPVPTEEEIVAKITPAISDELRGRFTSGDGLFALLESMDAWHASDLFLGETKPPAVRVHGRVIPLELPAVEHADFERFLDKILKGSMRRRFEDDGDLDVGYALESGHRFRLNLHRQRGLIGAVARSIPSGALSFQDLGLPASLKDLGDQPRGLVLVTGATGSGKSTTLAAILHYINSTRHAHVVTIEEPIEFVHHDILSRMTQREVGADTLSFHHALKHVVRESPDVIMIGEMRDMETMSVALSAALTGHLVFSTLHTIDAVQTLQRIMSYYPEHMRHQVAMDLSLSLRGIVSQRLVPSPDGESRVLAFEILSNTPAVSQLLREQRIEELADQLRDTGDPGLVSFNRSLLDLYRQGKVTFDVGKAYSSNPEEFALSAQGMETGIATFRDAFSSAAGGGLDIKSLLRLVTERKASDLHLTSGRPPIFRINGVLEPLPVSPLTEGDMRILLHSVLSVRQRTVYQLEREIDFALALDQHQRFRVNAYFQKGKMAMSLRAIPTEIPDPKTLRIPGMVMKLAQYPQGLVLVVGPTGSGKSTTLACMIDHINRYRQCRILTIEDPIEFTHESKAATIDQREVFADTKSFSSALKYILRQDPDVILVGEMRDLDTISAALTAAETGHLVLATLHANDAVQTIDRVIDVFPAHQQEQVRAQLASALTAVVSQRLLPNRNQDGRVAAFEILVATPAARNLIREDKLHQLKAIMEASRSMGMVTMDAALVELVNAGEISREAAMLYAINPTLFAR